MNSTPKLQRFSNGNNCNNCKEMSKQLQNLKETIEKQNNAIIEILAEHKVLLSRMVSQNESLEAIISIFPVHTKEKLTELNTLLEAQPDPYIKQMKRLIKGNVERYLHEILGFAIISSFNVDGTHGKARLRDYKNVHDALIDIISSYNDAPDQILRSAFQRQKKKYFKLSRATKNKKQPSTNTNENDS